MEEMYGLMNYHDHHHQLPPADASRDSYHHQFDDQSPEFRHKRTVPAVFGSTSNLQTSSSNNHDNNNNRLAEELDEDFSTANRAKIMSHPLYPKLLQAYIACQKVGAPPNIANLFDEIFRDNDFSRRSTACSCLGDDPELDEFMETYCEMLDKYRSDLARPFDEATTFLNNMQTQLTNLCKGASITYNSAAGVAELAYGAAEVDIMPSFPAVTRWKPPPDIFLWRHFKP